MPQSHDLQKLPPKVDRNAADQWRVDHDLTVTAMARAIGVAQPDLRRALLPANHKDWRKASLSIREKVKAYTRGEIKLDDWPEAPPPKADAAARALSKENHHAA